MKTDVSDLPLINPNRTRLQILQDLLELMELNQPYIQTANGRWEDCVVCGYPLTGGINPKIGPHKSFSDVGSSKSGCDWLRGIAELRYLVQREELNQPELAY